MNQKLSIMEMNQNSCQQIFNQWGLTKRMDTALIKIEENTFIQLHFVVKIKSIVLYTHIVGIVT